MPEEPLEELREFVSDMLAEAERYVLYWQSAFRPLSSRARASADAQEKYRKWQAWLAALDEAIELKREQANG